MNDRVNALRGSGVLSFGVSANDPDAQKAEFEYL